jgi:hypothetical protein
MMIRFAYVLILLFPLASVAQTSAPATEPATRPALTHEQQVSQLIDYLNGEYAKLLKSPDWIERSLAAISLARLPGNQATEQLLGLMKNDAVPAVRIVAWQGVLARAKWLNVAQYQTWLDITSGMAHKDLFRGGTRVGLIHMMAQNPPSRAAKLAFVGIFAKTNALEPRDIPVIDALADCLAAWKTPDVAEYLFNRLSNPNDAYRAEYLLHRAGLDTPWAGEHQDLGSVRMWKIAVDNDQDAWRHAKPDWKPLAASAIEAWKTLDPQYIPRPDLDAPIDPTDEDWRKETELGRAGVKPLDVAFVVDATGSMQPVLDFLKSDMGRIKLALELVANQPRIGVTFYRDFGDSFVTRSTKLTDKLTALDAFMSTIIAHGGGDRPEAVREALNDALKNNPWAWKRDGRRALVLMTDAPPHRDSQDDCLALAKACKDRDIRLLIMKVRSATEDQEDMRALDEIAQAAGTEPMWAPLPDPGRPRYPQPMLASRETLDAVRVAYAPPADTADRQILRRLLVDAINPQFADRVEPLVDIMLALITTSPPEKRLPFGVPGREGGVDMSKPRDPQAR